MAFPDTVLLIDAVSRKKVLLDGMLFTRVQIRHLLYNQSTEGASSLFGWSPVDVGLS